MKLSLKNVFLSVAVLAFTLALVGAFSTHQAEAAACTIFSDGTWDGVANANGAGNAHGTVVFANCAGGGAFTPAVGDTLTITQGRLVTLTGNATTAGLTIDDPAGLGTTTLTINTGVTLTDSGNLTFTANTGAFHGSIVIAGTGALNVTGNTTFAAPTSTGNEVLSVTGAGSFSTVALTMTGNAAAAGKASVSMGAGTLTATGLVTLTGAADATGVAELTSSSGILNLNAGLTFAGTVANTKLNNSTGTVNFTGTMTGAGVLSISGTLNTTGTTALNSPGSIGVFNVVSGTTTIGAGAFTFTTTTVSGTLDISGATAKHFSSHLTINEGGTFTNSGNVDETLSGNLTNNGTFTAGTGVYTLDGGATKTITGTVSIPSLTVSGVYQNNGVLTVATALAGAGTLTNGASATLNYGGAGAIAPTLTATAVGNTVNYIGGVQTVNPTNYYNLTLSGTVGTKTFSGAHAVGYDLVIDTSAGAVTVTVDNTITVSGGLKLGGSWKSAGSWTSTNAATYIVGAGTITNALSHSSTSTATTYTPPPTTTTTTTTDTSGNVTVTTTTTIPDDTNTTGCSGGNQYNTSTGALCNNNVQIPGCGNKTTGFSTASGTSCANNRVASGGATVTTTTTTYNFGTVTLKNGSRGNAVMELQRFLNAKLGLGLVVDGKLGPKTIAVIKKWQSDNGLVSDGLVGAKTKAKMNADN